MSQDSEAGKNNIDYLLKCLIHVIGRVAVPVEKVKEVIGTGSKQIKAFNLLNGNNSLTDVAKKSRIYPSNLSRTVKRWIEEGIVFQLGEEKQSPFMHIYLIPSKSKKRKK
jgi:hypothetical protein